GIGRRARSRNSGSGGWRSADVGSPGKFPVVSEGPVAPTPPKLRNAHTHRIRVVKIESSVGIGTHRIEEVVVKACSAAARLRKDAALGQLLLQGLTGLHQRVFPSDDRIDYRHALGLG